MKELVGKVAFVTGAAGGIGLGIARVLAEAGMNVGIADIDEPSLMDAASELRRLDVGVVPVRLDVTDRGGWERAASSVRDAIGPVQVLVNNAGVSTSGMRFQQITPDIWDRVVAINLTGVYNGVHHFLDAMVAAGGGHIVNTSSMAGLIAGPLLAPYAATKFGVVGLSEALRAELGEVGVGVSVLCPGGVRTRMWRTSRRARGLPDTDRPPDDLSGQSARADMHPDEVGRRVVHAIVADEPYIFTHPEFREPIAERQERLLAGFDRAASFPG